MAGPKSTTPKSAPSPGERPNYVLGSRPPALRQKPPGSTAANPGAPRIKPMTGQTQYGKGAPAAPINGAGPTLPAAFGG